MFALAVHLLTLKSYLAHELGFHHSLLSPPVCVLAMCLPNVLSYQLGFVARSVVAFQHTGNDAFAVYRPRILRPVIAFLAF